MAELPPQIAFVQLARDRVRLFLAPAVFIGLAAAAVAGGLLAGGPARISLLALGALAGLAGIYLGSLVSSYRLLVEPGGLKLRWLGGERRYRLVHGSVTRVMVSGRGAAALHPRFGALGWAVGPAVLRGEEPIELIRLSIVPALIVVPTDRGRLGIAASLESDLLTALRHAISLQERLDEAAARRAQPAPVAAPPPEPAPAPRVLTGIERSLIEQRLAAQRAALAAAQAAAAIPMPQPPTPVATARATAAAAARPAPRASRARQRARWQRPAWLAVPGPASVAAAMPIALPLIGAAIAWIAITITGRPALPSDEARLLLLGLALIGPIGAIGGFIARTWYPRLGGLVSASAIASLAMLTRNILA
ncbi:MAG: hypothetical protein ABI578_02045 [Chloroflexota bacterium]